jgi:hypothetical protein
MPISPYLDGFPFDAEAKRVMGIAFEMTCVALRVNRTDPIAEKVAKRIIELAKNGERNPDRCAMTHWTSCADRRRHNDPS